MLYVGPVPLLVMPLPGTIARRTCPFVTFLTKLGGAGGIMDIVILTAALSSVKSGPYSTGRIRRSLSINGPAPWFTGKTGCNGMPYAGSWSLRQSALLALYLTCSYPAGRSTSRGTFGAGCGRVCGS